MEVEIELDLTLIEGAWDSAAATVITVDGVANNCGFCPAGKGGDGGECPISQPGQYRGCQHYTTPDIETGSEIVVSRPAGTFRGKVISMTQGDVPDSVRIGATGTWTGSFHALRDWRGLAGIVRGKATPGDGCTTPCTTSAWDQPVPWYVLEGAQGLARAWHHNDNSADDRCTYTRPSDNPSGFRDLLHEAIRVYLMANKTPLLGEIVVSVGYDQDTKKTRFQGTELVEESNHSHQGPNQNRFHEWTLYRLPGGKYRVVDTYITHWQGESGYTKLTREMTGQEVARKYPRLANEAVRQGEMEESEILLPASEVEEDPDGE